MSNYSLLFDTFLIILSMFMLWKGADWLVESASRIASTLKVSDLVIGLTVVAIGTSAPEFAVTISAAIMGKDSISIGNVVGSNIFNLGLILGGTALIRQVTTTPKLVYRDGLFLFSVTVLLYLILFGPTLRPTTTSYALQLNKPAEYSELALEDLSIKIHELDGQSSDKFKSNILELDALENYRLPKIYDSREIAESTLNQLTQIQGSDITLLENVGGLNWLDGIIMLIILLSYLIFLFVKKEPLEEEDIPHDPAGYKDGLFLLLGIILVVYGGHLLVESATGIARVFGISEWVIAVTIVAAGTSAPEFATSLMAAWKGKHGMAIGNLFGSDLFNILGVLGLAGIINPAIVSLDVHSSITMLIGQVALVLFFMRSGWKISRTEGGILFGLNLFRWYLDFSG